jgi:hypothetical protein
LVGKAEEVRGISAGRLEANGVADYQGTRDDVGRWSDRAQDRILHRVIIEPTGKLAYGASGLQSAQRRVYGRFASKIAKVLWREHPGPTVTNNTATYRSINGLSMICHSFLTEIIELFTVRTRRKFRADDETFCSLLKPRASRFQLINRTQYNEL